MRVGIFLVTFFLLQSLSAQIEFFEDAVPVKSLNSPYDENFLSLHPDGSILVITRRNHPGNIGESYNPADLWLSEFDSIWQSPENIINVHPDKSVTPLGFINGGEYFVYNTTQQKMANNEGNLWISEFSSKGLSNTKKLQIPYFSNKSKHQAGSISADGRFIVLSMEGTTSFGVEDLYVMFLREDGTWSGPRNLGYRVNTAFQEYAPFLAPDNETLIFATNGRGGYGSFDLFVTQRIDDTWQNWTEPVNLGPKVNSNGSETSFVFNPGDEFAYFTSTIDSDGYGDIKKIRIRSDIEEKTEASNITIKYDVGGYENVFTLKDTRTDKIITGTIVINDSTGGYHETPYTYEFDELQDIYVKAKAPGYLEFDAVITASELESQELIIIPMVPLEVGTTVNLDNVLFYQGTANFIEGSEKELEKVVTMMKENPNMRILIKGHTDNVGIASLNQALSEERVNVVIEYLNNKGIESDRLEGKGFGGSDPIAPNDSEANRQLNRRVEFTILKN